jgi:hypothetical protein
MVGRGSKERFHFIHRYLNPRELNCHRDRKLNHSDRANQQNRLCLQSHCHQRRRDRTGFNAIKQRNAHCSPPGSPTGVTAAAGDHQAIVSFTAPASNGRSPITSYTVTAYFSNGTVTATATGAGSPITVTGLTNGVAYYFTVSATNSAGTGSASAPSNSVTPNPPNAVPALGPWGLPAAAAGLALPARVSAEGQRTESEWRVKGEK